MTTPAVLYQAKSTEDRHGSIGTQSADCRALAEREGWTIVDEFQDEGFSAYKGNRGAGLRRAKALAEQAAAEYGTCILVVQHSDRLARGAGDAPGAADHLGELFFQLRRKGVRIWRVDGGPLDDPIYAVLEGQRNTEDSSRKSASTRDGKRRRWERGDSTGPLQFGYRFEDRMDEHGRVVTDRGGVVTRDRISDPQTAPLVVRLFELAAEGKGYGPLTRWLNGQGAVTIRGNPFGRSRIKEILKSRFYIGEVVYKGEWRPGNHQPLIEHDLFERVQAQLKTSDPVSVRSRKGGPPTNVALLSKLLTCGRSGGGLWHRKESGHYVCGHRRHATGVCDLPPIKAETLDRAFAAHLDGVFLDFGGAIARITEERTTQRDALEAELQQLRKQLAELDRDEELFRDDYRKAIRAADESRARMAQDEVTRTEQDRDHLRETIANVEARHEEHAVPPEVDSLLDWWNGFAAAIKDRVTGAQNVREANAALRDLLASAVVNVEPEHNRVTVDIVLKGAEVAEDGTVDMAQLWLKDGTEPRLRPPGSIVRYTKVNRCLAEGRARLRQLGALA